MKRLLAAAALAGGMASAWAATGPIGPGAVPLDGWERQAAAPLAAPADPAGRGAAESAGEPGALAAPANAVPLGLTTAGPAAQANGAAPLATAGTAEDAALGLHVIPDLRPHTSPWALLAVAVLALGYVLVKRPR